MATERPIAARHTSATSRVTRAIAHARLLPILAVVAVTLAACSGDDPRPSVATDLAVPTPATAPFALPTPWEAPPPTPVGPATPPDDLAPEIPEGVPIVAPAPGAPNSLLDESGWPRGAVGPLVGYERFVREDQRRVVGLDYSVRQTVTTVTEVVTYDLGARRQVTAFELGGRSEPSTRLMGSKLLVNFHRSLWTYNLDGSGGVELAGGPDYERRIERVVPNADGTLIAINHFVDTGDLADNLIEVLDVRTGDTIMELAQSDLPNEFVGTGGPVAWTPGGDAIVLVGYRYTEARGSVALLGLDGVLTVSDVPRTSNEVVDATGERPTVEYSGGLRACAVLGYNGMERIALVDPDSGRELAAIESRWPALGWGEWSPEGSELLASRRDLSDEIGAAIRDAYVGPGCPESPLADEAWARPAERFLLRVDEPHLIAVAGRREALDRWWGDRLVTFACGGEEAPGDGTGGRSSPTFSDQDCYGSEHEIRVGGELIGAGRRSHVLGFVDREPEPAEAAAAPPLRADPVFVHRDPGVRTGVEVVDFVIEAMLTREPERLVERIAGWEQRACFTNWTGGSPSPPLCPQGVANGALIESFLVGDGGEGRYLGRAEVARFARLADGWGLYSVRAERPDPDSTDVEYVVLFGAPPGDGTSLLTTSVTATVGGVTRISVGGFSDGHVEGWSTLGARGGSGPPLLPATTLSRNESFPNSGARRVGLGEIDEVIQTVLLRDSKGLEVLVALTEVECATELGIGAPPSCERLGLRRGTLVATLPASQCEGHYITRPELRDALSQSFGELSPELAFFGVFQAARGQWRDLPRPDYVIMFRPTGDLERIGYRALHILDGRIVFLEGGCGAGLPREESIARWIVDPAP